MEVYEREMAVRGAGTGVGDMGMAVFDAGMAVVDAGMARDRGREGDMEES